MSGAKNRWHVSPAVDLAAYAFSWAFILLPLELLPGRSAQIAMLLLVVGLTFAHRHYALPYVYLDREIFERHPRRFVWFPALVLVGFALTPMLWRTPARPAVALVVLFAGAWNVWHVYMQKFGILRLYAAKSGSPGGPRWADLGLLFCWVPLYFVWLAPSYRTQIETAFPTVRDLVLPVVDALADARVVWLAPAIACVAAGIGAFLWFEYRYRRLRNLPRLAMASGTTLLAASFLAVSPVRVFMAFAFSHAVEYMVFVWAFQKRRYRTRLPHDPLLGRLLSRPVLAYGVFTLGITAPYLVARFWGSLLAPDASSPVIFGTTLERWGFYFSVYQSLVHFYYDGFLWKMGDPSVRASV